MVAGQAAVNVLPFHGAVKAGVGRVARQLCSLGSVMVILDPTGVLSPFFEDYKTFAVAPFGCMPFIISGSFDAG